MRPRPTNAIAAPGASSPSAIRAELVDHGRSGAKRVERRGQAAVDGSLEEHLADLDRRDAVAERAAHVRGELVLAVHGGQHPEVEDAARPPIEALTRPDGAPAVFGDELLDRRGELRHAVERAVEVLGAEHLAARGQTLVVAVAPAHEP